MFEDLTSITEDIKEDQQDTLNSITQNEPDQKAQKAVSFSFGNIGGGDVVTKKDGDKIIFEFNSFNEPEIDKSKDTEDEQEEKIGIELFKSKRERKGETKEEKRARR